jgi:hypothetical protein
VSITIDEINRFHQFAVQRIEQSQQGELTLDDLLIEWDSTTHREEINEAIREGIADVDGGRTYSVTQVNRELKAKYNLGE